jgi:hypothetical protein
MARPDVSPKGLGAAVRMIQYFINRGGKNLSPHRRRNSSAPNEFFSDARAPRDAGISADIEE